MHQSTVTAASPRAEAGVPRPVVDDRPGAVDGVSRPLLPNDRVGRYVIERQLGRGGMGIVYGAWDRELGRRVALKLVRSRLRPSPYDAQFSQRLRREAQALARLSHPNVVSLYDLGTSRNAVFLAMAFVEGEHLGRTLARDRPGWRSIVALLVQAGRGLAAAHAAGLVHRDFKPTNVIVGPGGHVTVVDFGLARGIDPSVQPQVDPGAPRAAERGTDLLSKQLTDANVVIGTRGYMAPEQLLGRPVGPAADQFAFCVALFEALYGALPYPAANAIALAHAFAAGHVTEPAARGDVPASIHDALLRGLSIEPGDRFPSMDALLDAVAPPVPARRRLGMAAAMLATAMVSAATTAWVGARDRTTSVDSAVRCDDVASTGPAPTARRVPGAVNHPPGAGLGSW